jgi:ADP-ribosylglycohydrolase
MRAAPFGVLFADDPQACEAFVQRSTLLTHTDPKALVAARAVARAAAWAVKRDERPSIDELEPWLVESGPADDAWRRLAAQVVSAAREDAAVDAFADRLGLEKGVTGYAYHTVPVVLYAWWRHWGDFEATLAAVFDCGGDTDTTGAVAGALAGAVVGEGGIPRDWVDGIADWPRGTSLLRRLADEMARLQEGSRARPVPYFWPGVLPRNAFFLAVVLAHGLRRLLPPY